MLFLSVEVVPVLVLVPVSVPVLTATIVPIGQICWCLVFAAAVL